MPKRDLTEEEKERINEIIKEREKHKVKKGFICHLCLGKFKNAIKVTGWIDVQNPISYMMLSQRDYHLDEWDGMVTKIHFVDKIICNFCYEIISDSLLAEKTEEIVYSE